MKPHVLVVDDDPVIREMVELTLTKSGFAVDTAENAEDALRLLEGKRFDVVVSDIYMREESGIDLLESVRRGRRKIPVILMTARGSVETAVIAERIGAFDYLAKPFDLAQLVARVRAAVEPTQEETAAVEPGPESMIVGSHPSMVEIYKSIARVAQLDLPVLVLGETGTGKELVARAIHELGARRDGPFVPVNCGAIPDTLLESELFGYVRGAFTDARRDRRGALAMAARGTVFLDEIGDISAGSQVKLLRFLQDRVVTPLGSERGERVDTRVVAATNRPLLDLVAAGTFRQDLYFRLAGYEIHLPPLRERLSDLPLLVEALRVRIAGEVGIEPPPPASHVVLSLFARHDWPGNVRELQQVVTRMLVNAGSLSSAAAAETAIRGTAALPVIPLRAGEGEEKTKLSTLHDVERDHIESVLRATGGNRTRAAEILGIERKTLVRKLRRTGD
jgi:DNA-binding NtrC family response regulator